VHTLGSNGSRINGDAGAEGGRNGSLRNVAALSRRGLQTVNLFQGCREVLRQLLSREGCLADNEVQVRVAVNAEVDLATLDVCNSLRNK